MPQFSFCQFGKYGIFAFLASFSFIILRINLKNGLVHATIPLRRDRCIRELKNRSMTKLFLYLAFSVFCLVEAKGCSQSALATG